MSISETPSDVNKGDIRLMRVSFRMYRDCVKLIIAVIVMAGTVMISVGMQITNWDEQGVLSASVGRGILLVIGTVAFVTIVLLGWRAEKHYKDAGHLV